MLVTKHDGFRRWTGCGAGIGNMSTSSTYLELVFEDHLRKVRIPDAGLIRYYEISLLRLCFVLQQVNEDGFLNNKMLASRRRSKATKSRITQHCSGQYWVF